MMRNLERRLGNLESSLPPLLTEEVSWMFGLLWFAIAYHLGSPSPDEKPFGAFARALGYANESELNAAIEKNHFARALRYANESKVNAAIANNHPDLANRLHAAENRVCAKFGIYVSLLKDCEELDDADKAEFWESLKRMEAGLPQSYKKQLKMVLARVNNLAWMRIYFRDEPGPYLSCFA